MAGGADPESDARPARSTWWPALVAGVRVDGMGNVIALKKGERHGQPECKKVMAAAHIGHTRRLCRIVHGKGGRGHRATG